MRHLSPNLGLIMGLITIIAFVQSRKLPDKSDTVIVEDENSYCDSEIEQTAVEDHIALSVSTMNIPEGQSTSETDALIGREEMKGDSEKEVENKHEDNKDIDGNNDKKNRKSKDKDNKKINNEDNKKGNRRDNKKSSNDENERSKNKENKSSNKNDKHYDKSNDDKNNKESANKDHKNNEKKSTLGVVRRRHSVRQALESVDLEVVVDAFGKSHELSLKKTQNLLSPQFKLIHKVKGTVVKSHLSASALASCHYVHSDEYLTAAISDCGPTQEYRGFVATSNETLEIEPLSDELEQQFLRDPSSLGLSEDLIESTLVEDLYLVKKVELPEFRDDHELELPDEEEEELQQTPYNNADNDDEEANNDEDNVLMVETALFVDHAAFSRLYDLYYTHQGLLEVVLASFNQLKALYKMPSLGNKYRIELVLSELHLHEGSEPKELLELDGERVRTLSKFCKYQNQVKSNSSGFDVGVYLTGEDIWHEEWGAPDHSTLGLARTGSLCHKRYSCVLAEFATSLAPNLGLTHTETSAGFGAVYILAHEMGHAFGMGHDGGRRAVNCTRDGFIMSSSRSSEGGETKWSQCSAQIIAQAQKTIRCLRNRPLSSSQFSSEKSFSLDAQCVFFLKDELAVALINEDDICVSLKCSLNDETYKAGPALDHSPCFVNNDENNKMQGTCRGGVCELS